MKKIASIMAAFAIIATFAVTGCEKQEKQAPPEKTAPSTAPTASAPTATGTGSASPGAK